MGEGPALDDALSGIVVDVDPFELVEELVAVPDAHVAPACRSSRGDGALHSVLAQRMGARPLGSLAAVAPLDARLQGGGSRDSGEDSGPAGRIVPRRDEVAQAEIVCLIFLVAREAQCPHLR